MLDQLRAIIADKLSIAESEITEESNFKDDLGADSLDLFELVMGVEEEFNLEIPAEDLEQIATVGDFIKYLQDKGVEA